MSPFLFVNMTSSVCCLLFLIFLFISYFSKKNMNNIENKIYKRLLIYNVLCVISYILFYTFDIICYMNDKDPQLYNIMYFFSKIAPVFLMAWGAFFVFYMIIITNELNTKFIDKVIKNEKKCFIFLYFYIAVLTVLHLLEHSVVDISLGIEYDMLYTMNISTYLSLGLVIFLIFINKNKMSKKKALPAFLIIPIVVGACLLVMFPIVFVYIIITLIDHLMFHTIENPDVKLINELTLAKTQAEQASNAKSDFLSSMSHELRTPLNAIVGLSQMIESESDNEEVKVDARDIVKSSQNLLELVDGILDINKLETDEMEIINNNYNPIEVFDDLVRMIKVRIGDKPIEFRYRYASNLPKILYGDKDKIKRVITNLLTNAVKYTDNGFIDFIVESNINNDLCDLKIVVKDTGRGISSDNIDKIFNKFYREEDDKDSDISGTGLGLSITKSLVELMNGKIEVDSTLELGTTFTINVSQKIDNATEN